MRSGSITVVMVPTIRNVCVAASRETGPMAATQAPRARPSLAARLVLIGGSFTDDPLARGDRTAHDRPSVGPGLYDFPGKLLGGNRDVYRPHIGPQHGLAPGPSSCVGRQRKYEARAPGPPPTSF